MGLGSSTNDEHNSARMSSSKGSNKLDAHVDDKVPLDLGLSSRTPTAPTAVAAWLPTAEETAFLFDNSPLIVAELMDSDGLDGWFDNWGYEGLATPTTSPSESRIMF